jgi:hypothetical protein
VFSWVARGAIPHIVAVLMQLRGRLSGTGSKNALDGRASLELFPKFSTPWKSHLTRGFRPRMRRDWASVSG